MRNLPLLPEKVLMTADTVGGVWDYSVELIRGLSRHGVHVALATMGATLSADQRSTARALPGLELFESGYRLEWMEEPWEDIRRSGEWLLSLEEQVEPDLVHLNGYGHAALPWRSPTLVVGHSCVLSWWRAVKGEPAPPAWDRYRELVAGGLRAAGAVTAPTEAMLAALEQCYFPLPAARAIHNGRSRRDFRPGRKENLILSVGRLWDEAKNVAAAAAAVDGLPWPLYLAGETEPPLGKGADLDGVRYLGRLSQRELAGWYAKASVYLLPARYEPFGLSVLEGALSGCALVLGDIPSLRELWDGAALFVAPDDPELIRETLRRVAGDPTLRYRLSAAALERGLSYTPERMTAGYLDLYRELLAERFAVPICRKGA